MFERLKEQFLADRATQTEKNRAYIVNGYGDNKDNGIRRYATDYVWTEYTAGRMTREKAIERATKRMERQAEKDTAAGLAKLEAAAAADDINHISVNVEYKRNRYWGWNPTATVYGGMWTEDSASGCGYDKESAAVAGAFNANPAILKILYTIKEQGLAEGKTSDSATACTGHDNRDICGYGAGYSVIPYFEGGVGVNCFWSILKKAGFTTDCKYGKHENYYTITKD